MINKLKSLVIILLFTSFQQCSDKKPTITHQVILPDELINFCIVRCNYFVDTLYLTRWDSLDKRICPNLIFGKNNKLSDCGRDIGNIRIGGIEEKSTWKLNSEKGIITLNVFEFGIDDVSHIEAEYKIYKNNADTMMLIKSKKIKIEDMIHGGHN